jgi:hypothetical protein
MLPGVYATRDCSKVITSILYGRKSVLLYQTMHLYALNSNSVQLAMLVRFEIKHSLVRQNDCSAPAFLQCNKPLTPFVTPSIQPKKRLK